MAGLHTPTAINVMTLESFQKKGQTFFPHQCMTGFHSSTMKMHRDLFLIQFKIYPALGSDSSSLTDFTVLIYIFSLETSVNYLGIKIDFACCQINHQFTVLFQEQDYIPKKSLLKAWGICPRLPARIHINHFQQIHPACT